MPTHTRDVLVSVQPKYVTKILTGAKTVELRRRFPESAATGAIALIYSSSPVRAVVGYARIREVLRLPISKIWREHSAAACISKKEFDEYFYGLKFGFAIFLEKIRLLTPEVAAADLQEKLGIVPPQSYRYVVKNCISLLRDDRLQAFDRHQRRNRA